MTLPRRLLAWYGDDFTGSTDVLDVLASRGLETVLFLEIPDEALLARFADYRAIGLAGIARGESPEWMSRNLPEIFEWMKGLGAPVCHYKVCSTFDSSPEVGSIGRAIEIGRDVFECTCVPAIVGAPALRRYMAFGNLFATVGADTYRIDRHPTMSRHPVTPMHEGDLRLHLGAQTRLRIGLVDVLDLCAQDPDARAAARMREGAEILFIDVFDEETLVRAGRVLWNLRPPFVAGSSGVEYALAAHWLGPANPPSTAPPRVDRVAILSGSCSPVTAAQIHHAASVGFAAIRLDVRAILEGAGAERAANEAVEALANDRSVVLYTSSSDADRLPLGDARNALAERAGRMFRGVLDRSGVRRAMVAGGDTSSHAGRQLSIGALTFLGRIAPGAPLCRAWSNDPSRDGMEIVFKGGHLGGPDFFERLLGA